MMIRREIERGGREREKKGKGERQYFERVEILFNNTGAACNK